MPLDKDVLGMALYNRRSSFSDKDYDELLSIYGSIENARIAAAKADADEIIKHFKAAATVSVTVTTTGTATNHAGSGTGTIQ